MQPDVNDLRPFKASEFKLDRYYYIKQDNGEFHLAIETTKEWNSHSEDYKQRFREGMKKMSQQNLLFVSINNPWLHPSSIRV